jgi:hypothetical protein
MRYASSKPIIDRMPLAKNDVAYIEVELPLFLADLCENGHPIIIIIANIKSSGAERVNAIAYSTIMAIMPTIMNMPVLDFIALFGPAVFWFISIHSPSNILAC